MSKKTGRSEVNANKKFELAKLALSTGQFQDALNHMITAYKLNKKSAEITIELANLYFHSGDYQSAKKYYLNTLEIDANCADAYNNLGVVHAKLNEIEEGLACFYKTIEISPENSDAYYNAGFMLYKKALLKESIPFYEKAIELQPSFKCYLNLGNSYNEMLDFDTALKYYEIAITYDPNFYAVYNNIGGILYKQRRPHEAIPVFKKAIELKPDDCEVKYNMGMAQLVTGELIQGWKNYENRNKFIMHDIKTEWQKYQIASNNTKPEWKGESLEGKTILVHTEQGLGDTIQFCRYLPLIKEYGCKIIFECTMEIVELIKTIGCIDVIYVGGISLDVQFDYHISVMSLPYIFKTNLSCIPANIPYFRVPKEPMPEIDQYTGFKIGLVWAGNPRKYLPHINLVDQRRSTKLEYYKPLSQIEGVTLFSLQKGEETETQINEVDFEVIDLMKNVKNFHDTAKIMQNLDLIISADTSVVHVAGALGRPIWMLSRYDGCWRWLLDRSDSPWYPTMKIFRQQEAGNWEPVINDIVTDLKKVIGWMPTN